MSLINSFNTDENFWVLNPQFKNIQPFKSLHNSDKTRGKGKSSKIMWYVAQVSDTSKDNLFRNMIYEERVGLLAQDFMEDNDFYDNNRQLLDPLIETYNKFHTTPAMRAMEEWNEKMIERSEFIKDTEYSMDRYEMGAEGKLFKIAGTSKQLDDMMKINKQLYDMYHVILKSLAEEDENTQVKGGQHLSMSDTGEI